MKVHNSKEDHNQPKGQYPKKEQASPLKSYAVYSSVAIQMIAIIGVGTYIGIKLDDNYSDGGNTYTLILSLTSVCLAIYIVIRRILAASKSD